ncbi:outer membrane protein assembly factor BamB family protein [Gimesia fumaroli]|uniref:Outer membrane biogenesis protein BamB n=1 Tax=Gimesia fumaroli TaxID=2527976 RepID=A0A518I4T1_9PLAN|nr:PQQ-binding-like beta-propeller repeat protein [Gimesia fumaroli]QDV48065.1 outer membrane biogenesis protein BamB [Gimesia fumaroli]
MRAIRNRAAGVLLFLVTLGVGIFSTALSLSAADWPTYRADAQRSGFTTDGLPEKLALHWSHQAAHSPQPAWPRSTRLTYDRVNHCVIAEGRVFFGDSVSGKVQALDLNTGKPIWEFFTEGPVRFAPTAWRDRLLVTSDDGFLYALRVNDGTMLWKHRGGPNAQMAVGNERVISKWPARGAAAVVNDVVYYAAGIWPSDGIYLYALNAETGKPIWSNTDSGQIYMPQPHGGANANSGISAQGYLAVAGDHLLVPAGRAVPASMNRLSGKFEYFHLQKNRAQGGGDTIVAGDLFLNSGVVFKAADGAAIAKSSGGPTVALPDGLVEASKGKITRYQWVETENPDRKGKLVRSKGLKQVWAVKQSHPSAALIIAGDKIVSGSDGFVDLVDLEAGKPLWSTPVEGVAYGLAASDSHLVVSTDRGNVYTFGSAAESLASKNNKAQVVTSPYPADSAAAKVAAEIVERTKIDKGYCFDVGCGDGALAYELANRTQLRIVAVESDPTLVALARQKLTEAGVYGSRVMVLQRPLDQTHGPNKVANLVVSGRSVSEGSNGLPMQELKRLQRPYGGYVCYGKPGKLNIERRGAIQGAGEWTHQYADAANTLCSNDKLVNGQLSMLWYRDFDFVIPSRHGRGPAPLFSRGRLFHEGNDGLIAVDAYNGHELWRFQIEGVLVAYDGDELMGASGTGSNYCLGGDFVFIRHEQRCFQLDAATGKVVHIFEVPPAKDPKAKANKQPWGYIAWHDGMLIGSAADPNHVVAYRYRATTGDMTKQLTESNRLFAFDTKTGKLKWQYDSEDSIRHNAIAIANEKLYLIDRPLADFDRTKESKRNPIPKTAKHATGQLLCLSIHDGYVLWKNKEDIYGTMIAVSAENDALLMSYQPTSFRLSSEKGGRLSVFNSTTGEKTWEAKANYSSRPLINGKTVYAQGGAWNLKTGKPQPFNFKRSYGCGVLASCENMMFFRSATLGYFDFNKNSSIENYGGVRPGCWINAIPAGGLVLVPDASAACSCSYLNKSWFALETQATH